MVAETRKQLVYVPELQSGRKTEQANASHNEGAQARADEAPRSPFLIDFAHMTTLRWFAGWLSSRPF
jgi:hypothetical protein